MRTIRQLRVEDLPAIAAMQAESPEAAQWPVDEYLGYTVWVAEVDGRPVGFLALRPLGGEEWEVLNLVVAQEYRRNRVASGLLERLPSGTAFLEVRAANEAARRLYESHGFVMAGKRKGYYQSPPDDAILMRRDPNPA